MLQSQCIPVYNYIYDKNNLTWGKYMHSVRKGLHQPLDKSFWYSAIEFITNETINTLVLPTIVVSFLILGIILT